MTAFHRLLTAAMLGGLIAVGAILAVPATVAGQANPERPAASYDLTHEDTGDYACWVEKVTSQDTAEPVCGPRGLRPAGSLSMGQETTLDGRVWVATSSGLEPVGAN